MAQLLALCGAPSPDALAAEYRFEAARAHGDAALEQIRKDAKRTRAATKGLSAEAALARQAQLVELLACAGRIGGVGYVQGMNFIGAALLSHCDPQIAYYVLRRLFEAVDAPTLYAGDLSEIVRVVNDFADCYFASRFPAARADLSQKSIRPELLFTEWFVTLGTSVVSPEFHIRLFEGLLEGGIRYLYKVLSLVVSSVYPIFRTMESSETIVALRGIGKRDESEIEKLGIRWNSLL